MRNLIISILKELYLCSVKLKSKFSKKKHDKIVFLLSFPETSEYILESLFERFGTDIIICYTKNSEHLAQKFFVKDCKIYSIDSFISLVKWIVPVVTGARFILCDNYFAFLAGINFNKQTKVVQLWHANGAIKLFGLEANYTKIVSKKDKSRYQNVYKKFTHYIVSSTKMSKIFEKNYQQSITILPYGYPVTDRYFSLEWLDKVTYEFTKKFNEKKKTLLYAPTYREEESLASIDFEYLIEALGSEWQILVNSHPHDKFLKKQITKYSQIITDFRGMDIQSILPSIDCLVTDYSSIPFEYTLANPNGKIIFFCYDLESYRERVGIEEDFEDYAPGPIVFSESDIVFEANKSNNNSFIEFNKLWNEYVDGTSIKRLIKWMEIEYEY